MTSTRDLDVSLHDGEFVAAEAGDKIGGDDAAAQTLRHRFQQFVADQVAERIVDALEFVDVDIEHRQMLIRSDPRQFVSRYSWNSARFGRSVRAS